MKNRSFLALNETQLMAWADAAVSGDGDALESLLLALKDPLFKLSLRILGNFADAESFSANSRSIRRNTFMVWRNRNKYYQN